MLARTAAAGLAAATAPLRAEPPPAKPPFRYCLNTATLMGHKLPLPDLVDIAAKAGYDGIEFWTREIDAFVKGGGNLDDLAKRIRDRGLIVENAIGFNEWIIDDDDRRAKGLENMKRDMELVARLGGKRIAASPAGANKQTDLSLVKAAERYRALLELGATMDIVPQLEIWGGSKTLSRVSEAAFVAIESGHADACLLLDVFHLYKGGSDFHSLTLLNGFRIHVFHVNDYPADPPRETVTDAQRVYPSDGVAPLGAIFRDLFAIGFCGALSVELFNRTYWQQDPLTVARTALEKTRAIVGKSSLENQSVIRKPAPAWYSDGMKPLIGITPDAVTAGAANKYGGFCGEAYPQAVERAGGVPMVLALTRDHKTLDQFLSRCDGFILSGGGDLCEASGAYGRKLTTAEQQSLSRMDALRDEMELYLARQLVEKNVPVLGICRGVQVMNVALGGTLLPDVPNHRGVTHGIKWTQPLFDCQQVNSSHHQALGKVASVLTVVARADDGVVEAVVLPAARFCVGVQFHPERMESCDEPFRKLVEAARARAAAR